MAGADHDSEYVGDAMPRIVRTAEVLGGDPRIEGTRVGVAHVYRRYVEGEGSPTDIASGYDIPLAAVHAALAYAFANPREMDAIAERNRQARANSDSLTPDGK